MLLVRDEVLQEKSWSMLLLHLIELSAHGQDKAVKAIAHKYFELLNKAKLEEMEMEEDEDIWFGTKCGLVGFIWISNKERYFLSVDPYKRSSTITFTPAHKTLTFDYFVEQVTFILTDLLNNSEHYLCL